DAGPAREARGHEFPPESPSRTADTPGRSPTEAARAATAGSCGVAAARARACRHAPGRRRQSGGRDRGDRGRRREPRYRRRRLLSEVKPDYSEEARRGGIEGDVVMEIVVRRDGSVGDVRIVQGLGAGLDERAVAAVRRWRFAPGTRQGTPVDVMVEVAVEFKLR